MTNGFGSWVKVMRILMKLSQEDLAKRVGLSQSAFSRIEQQKSDPKLSHVVKILKEFGIDLDRILVENSKKLEDFFK